MKRVFFFAVALAIQLTCLAQTKAGYQSGVYKGSIGIGTGVVLNKGIGDRMLELETCHGKAYDNGSFFGAGASVQELETGLLSCNLFTEYRYTLSADGPAPFVSARSGWQFGDYEGAFVRLGIGAQVGRWDVSIYYRLQGGDSYRLNFLGIGTGFNF